MKLSYKGFDKTGAPVSDTIEARDVADASETLRKDGVYILQIGQAEAGGTGELKTKASMFGKGGRMKNVAMFMRQMHVLVSTGSTLVEALSALERQATDANWKAVIVSLRGDVEQGLSLSTAMERHSKYFDAVCRGLVSAGESGGHLDVMLERLAVLTRKQVHVRGAVIGAMVYPCMLSVVALAVLFTLLTFVLPRFTLLFKTLDTALPPTTQLLMNLSDWTRNYWWTIPVIVGGIAFGVFSVLKTPQGKRGWDAVVISFPRIGAISRSFETARIVRLIGILLNGHVPLMDALSLTRDSTKNHFYNDLLGRACDVVTRGEPLANAFAGTKLVPSSVAEAMRSGDKSGQMATLLNTVADFLDEENEVTLKSLTSILEPIILVVLGVLVGFVAISMFMPLFDLTAAARG